MVRFTDKFFLGTSGWSYKEWIGPFYSKEDKSMLRAYAKVFKSVEINSTFYRYPSKGTVMGWVRYSPEGLVYSAKLPKVITHEKKLNPDEGVKGDLDRFIELMEPLSLDGKLGCVLIQLPPRFNYNPKSLEAFFGLLPAHIRFAVEFRDQSWMRQETWELLKKYEVAYTIVDEPLLPPEMHITSNIAYFRWHGHGSRPWYNYRYSTEELEPWVPKVKEVAKKVDKVYGYLNNHYHGYAVENCLQILDMLGDLTPAQVKAKERVENYFKRSSTSRNATLEAFVETKESGFEMLLRHFLDARRLDRARRIKDDELTVIRDDDERIEAVLRDYHIVIDFQNGTVLHDCADWSRVLQTKKLCKHIGKLLLSIERERAEHILKKMRDEKAAWQFKPYAE